MDFVFLEDSEWKSLGEFISTKWRNKKLVILCDENTETYCLPRLLAENPDMLSGTEIISVPPGESSKSLALVEQLTLALNDLRIDRNAGLICLGGGVITDLGGFLASVYKRGIPFINVPTSLLAMIDASVGGKTGVNAGILKNQIGTFNHPEGVFVYPAFLETLPILEKKSAYGEILKHALISSVENWNHLKDIGELDEIGPKEIITSMQVKAEVVQQDFKEGGVRKILNFGHTVGHAIESWSIATSRPLLHGEAVAWGMVVEAELSKSVGLPLEQFVEIEATVRNLFEPIVLKTSDLNDLISLMGADKKNTNEQLGFVLLKNIGNPVFDQFIDSEKVLSSLKKVFEL